MESFDSITKQEIELKYSDGDFLLKDKTQYEAYRSKTRKEKEHKHGHKEDLISNQEGILSKFKELKDLSIAWNEANNSILSSIKKA